MPVPILVDLIFLAIVVFFVWLGAKRGFVLTLCSLLAVVVAFVGATILSNAAAPVVAGAIQPHLESAIEETLEERAADIASTDDVVEAVRDLGGVFQWAADSLDDALEGQRLSRSVAVLTSKVASAVAVFLARRLLFAIAFALLLILWGIFSRALNLVTKLPVIHSLNQTLGGLLGAVKGLVLALAALWILRDLTGAISRETVEGTYLVGPLLDLIS